MHLGRRLKDELTRGARIAPFIGVYDAFSARIAARHSSNLFLSGFGFAASHYGLPDVGYIAWSDMVQAASRIRQILPSHGLLVDIDDGYVDTDTACHVTRHLDSIGVAMIMLEDQGRPRRCGHLDGKIVLPLATYLEKLERVLDARENVCVLARTDAVGGEIYERVAAFSRTRADAILVDGVGSLDVIDRVRSLTDKPLLFNQLAGGKSPRLSLGELRALGVQMALYSTPCLFAAQAAMQSALEELFSTNDGRLVETSTNSIGLRECIDLLTEPRT